MSGYPETNGGRLVHRGDTFDPECARTSYRLRMAHGILASMGIKPIWHHSDCERVEHGRPRHACDYRCRCEWPEWVPGETFDLAYRLANVTKTAAGAAARAGVRTAIL